MLDVDNESTRLNSTQDSLFGGAAMLNTNEHANGLSSLTDYN